MRWTNVILILGGVAASAVGQEPPSSILPEPRPLPPSFNDAPTAVGSALTRFDAERLIVKRVGNRSQLWAGEQFLKDFGPNEREAREALRLVRDLHFTQYGTIAGAIPAFEFWLSDPDGMKGGLAVKNVIPFNPRTLKADNVAGAWIIRDDKIMLYNFGTQHEAAEQALAVIRQFGFNQLGIIGMPTPLMTYLTTDPHAHPPDPRGQPDTKEIINKIAEQGVVLPNIGYAGGRLPIENRRLEVAKVQSDWAVVHGKDVLGRFGPNYLLAREALRLLQNAKVTELCLIGTSGFPIYLSNGQAPRHAGLGFNNIRLQPALMKVQVINYNACITEGDRIVFEFHDNRADAELVIKVLQYFQVDQLCPIGDPANGGIRLMIRSK